MVKLVYTPVLGTGRFILWRFESSPGHKPKRSVAMVSCSEHPAGIVVPTGIGKVSEVVYTNRDGQRQGGPDGQLPYLEVIHETGVCLKCGREVGVL